MLNLMWASREEVERAHRAYVAGIDDAIAHFQTVWPGEELDYSIESLGRVGAWFAEKLEDGLEVDSGWLPAWWDPKKPPAGEGDGHAGTFTRRQLKLIDDAHAYIGAVVLRTVPDAQRVVYKGSKKDHRNGDTVLQLDKRMTTYPLSLVYGSAVGAVLLDKPVDTELFREVMKDQVLIAQGG